VVPRGHSDPSTGYPWSEEMRKDLESTTLNNEAAAAITVSQLLNPPAHFGHPRDVLAAAHLDEDEKRAILASWASDLHAVESIPALRYYPGTRQAVSYDEILHALNSLDQKVEVASGASVARAGARRPLWRLGRRRAQDKW
jgi:hypothetical protein